ncbi:tetraacyldisaccharide 4'-kinase [Marinomonas balearica]|uniref:Tetraacyldisaccharide 4'-kinase n=1 Tax=Marinomonas balearica TaxID=491947 RepID=A0A4V3CG98_9GAMM|nr:tetraacyldisaccharide 4'-kinase [Marinomonas balearica]TDO96892.1 lipid-A-disaccharide kinase [Marinomonas balearica]
MTVEKWITDSWYTKKIGVTWLLAPLLPVAKYIIENKRLKFLSKEGVYKSSLPVIVVGNITVGGTGKSPMVVAVCELLKAEGFSPAIISRGHGANVTAPTLVSIDSSPYEFGDEPVMLAKRTNVPVCVCKNRVEAVRFLESREDVNVVVCDDGMQHYPLDRDIEIAMIDAKRGVGNGFLLPVGPLREPVERLNSVDLVFSVGKPTFDLSSIPSDLCVCDGDLQFSEMNSVKRPNKKQPLSCLAQGSWHVIAGIGNPSRFWRSLIASNLPANSKVTWFSDHHRYVGSDLPAGRLVMTEKDAVKCALIAREESDWWYVPVSLNLPDEFKLRLLRLLKNIVKERKR